MTENTMVDPVEIPVPVGYRVLVRPSVVENKSSGGILLDASTTDANKHLTYTGMVVAMGELCYTDKRFAIGDRDPKPWCKVGDKVLFGQYAGQKIKILAKDGSEVEMVMLNDDEIKGRVKDPVNYRAYI